MVSAPPLVRWPWRGGAEGDGSPAAGVRLEYGAGSPEDELVTMLAGEPVKWCA